MAHAFVIHVAGMGSTQYDDVMHGLGYDVEDAVWPDGLLSHAAGATPDGWCVLDVFTSAELFERHIAEKVAPVLARLGIPQPTVTPVVLHNVHVENARVRTTVERIFEMVNTGDLSVLDELLAPDSVELTAAGEEPGRQSLVEKVTMFRAGFPDLHCTIEDLQCVGNRATWRIVATGTHTGELMGIAPTGRAVRVEGMDSGVFDDEGRAVQHRSILDMAGLLTQLGVLPGPPGEVPAQGAAPNRESTAQSSSSQPA